MAAKHKHNFLTGAGCIYCNSKTYGKGCPYSPNGVHTHTNKIGCMYCGSTAVGKGCPYSPNGVHVRFTDFGQIQAESTNNHLIFSYMIEQFKKPFNRTKAYKMGLIDESGNQLRDAENEGERAAYTPIDRYVFKLKRIFEKKLDALNTDLFLEYAFKFSQEEDVIDENFSAEIYTKKYDEEEKLKKDLARVQNEFYNILRGAEHNNISRTKIEKILLQVVNEQFDKN